MPEWLSKLIEWIIQFFKTNPPPAGLPADAQPPVSEPIATKPLPSDSRPFLRLVDTGATDGGLRILSLQLKTNASIAPATINVVSGQPGKQALRQAGDSRAGSLEPIPEGYYDVGALEWAGAIGDYKQSFGTGLGPVWASITPKMKTERSALGFHLDENAATSPGTAGCVAFRNLEDLKKFVSWFANPATAPKSLTVNWKLGSVETAISQPTPTPIPVPGKEIVPDHTIWSPNHNEKREQAIDHIVLHNTDGSVGSAVARFMDPGQQVSAHYIVGRDGKVTKMVQEAHTAWHAGDHVMNHRSVGIEIEAGKTVGLGMTPEQEARLVGMVKLLVMKYKIDFSRIIPHRDVVATDCPGWIWANDDIFKKWVKDHI